MSPVPSFSRTLGAINDLRNTSSQAVNTAERAKNLAGSAQNGIVPPAHGKDTATVPAPAAANLPAPATEEKIEVRQVLKKPEPDKAIDDAEFAKKLGELSALIKGHQKLSNEDLAKISTGFYQLDRTGKYDKQLQEMLNDKSFDGLITDEQKRYIRARAVAGDRGLAYITKDIAENIPADQSKLMASHHSLQRAALDPAIPPEMSAKATAAAERGIRSYNLARAILTGNETEVAKIRIDGDPARPMIADTVSARKDKLSAAISDNESKLLSDPAIKTKLGEFPSSRFAELGEKIAPFVSFDAPLIRNKDTAKEMLAYSLWGERVAAESAKSLKEDQAKRNAPSSTDAPAGVAPQPPETAQKAAEKTDLAATKPNDAKRIESYRAIMKDGSFGSSFVLDNFNSIGRDDVWVNQTNRIVVAKAPEPAPAPGAALAAAGGDKTGAVAASGNNPPPAAKTEKTGFQKVTEATDKIPVVGGAVKAVSDIGQGAVSVGKTIGGWFKKK